jgi:hypothetical protein
MNGGVLKTAVAASGLFAFCFLIANLFSPSLTTTFWTEPRRSFDLDFYLSISERGYLEPSWPAFYPLWPLVLNWYSNLLQLPTILPMAHLLSMLFFFAATLPLWNLVKDISNSTTANWVIILASLNPNAIFHALAYPESFFSLLAILLIRQVHLFLVSQHKRHLFGVAVLTGLIAVTRPILPQLVAAGIGTIIFLNLKQRNKRQQATNQNWLKISILMLFAGMASYIPFGFICYQRFGDFFQPFVAQSLWNRKFGLYWDLILKPQTVGGSDNVLGWELLAFYGPPAAILYHLIQSQPKQEKKSDRAATSHEIIIFCLMVCAAHGAIAFLTYPIFMSLGRHVLATPFFFIGVAGLITVVLKKPAGRKLLLFLTVISAAYLINFWTRFARSAWIG